MKNKALTLFLIIFNFIFSFSQDFNLAVFSIPDSLSKNANSVVRFYDTDIELSSHKKMVKKIKKAITVLNKHGDHESKVQVYYDKNTHIKSLKVLIFDADGKEIKKVTKNKFEDYAAADGISLFNDNRLKYYRHVPISYPYTVFYEIEIETSNTAFIPQWMPIDAYNQSIQNSKFSISHPNEISLKKVENQFSIFKVKKDSAAGLIKYMLTNQPPIKYEEYSPRFIDIFPYAKLASNKFHLEGYDGNADSWDDFGKWMYSSLIAHRGEIPQATKDKIKALVKDIDDPIERARKVYEFVQNKTRYISVQVGIGGWMPMLAADVDRLAYGDCKALTNYTKVLLDAAGVESYYTAVHAGNSKKDMINEVVSVQGNHVFLYVPSKEKSYWLECTSQTTPFGYQGSFTDDRDVLVISPEGGKIIHTPSYDEEKSLQLTKADYLIDQSGKIKATINIQSSGLQYKNHYDLEKKSKKDIEDYYKTDYWSHLNNLNILKTEFTNNKREILFTENVEIEATSYASFSGDRMLIVLNPFNRYHSIPKRYRNRKQSLYISRGFYDKDEFILNLPEGYKIEAIPQGVEIENKFGKYSYSVEKLTDKKLKYSRDLLLKKGLHPKEDYNSYRKFKKQISKFDNAKIILTKN